MYTEEKKSKQKKKKSNSYIINFRWYFEIFTNISNSLFHHKFPNSNLRRKISLNNSITRHRIINRHSILQSLPKHLIKSQPNKSTIPRVLFSHINTKVSTDGTLFIYQIIDKRNACGAKCFTRIEKLIQDEDADEGLDVIHIARILSGLTSTLEDRVRM